MLCKITRWAGLMLRSQPLFKETSKLARYIEPDFRRTSGRTKLPKPGAYQKKLNEDHLSVNSLEVETAGQIAQTYAERFEQGRRPVAIASPNIRSFNGAAGSVGLSITFDTATGTWNFMDGGIRSAAYLHRPKNNNVSHSGVEFVRTLHDFAEFKFAVRVAKSATYRMV
jgi:hypothetical protein